MTITISDGTLSTSPLLVLGYRYDQETINTVHTIPGRPSPAVTLFGTNLRTGTMSLLYPSTTTAEAARELLATASTFTYTDTEQPELALTFIVDGTITAELEDESRLYWIVGFSFREVDG